MRRHALARLRLDERSPGGDPARAGRGQQAVSMTHKRVGAALWKLKVKGIVGEVPLEGLQGVVSFYDLSPICSSSHG